MSITKNKIKKRKLLHELTLLLPAYSYMYEQYILVLEAKDSAEEMSGDIELLLLKTHDILEVLRKEIMKHKKMHKEAIEIAKSTFDSLSTKGHSVFLIGLNALIVQSCLKNREIEIVKVEDIYDLEEMVLQELIESNLDYSNTLEMLEIFSLQTKQRVYGY
jgi:hypothetical protein